VTTLREKIKELLRPYSNLPKEVYVIFVARIINAMGVLVFPLLTLILVKKIGLLDFDNRYPIWTCQLDWR